MEKEGLYAFDAESNPGRRCDTLHTLPQSQQAISDSSCIMSQLVFRRASSN
jgi:hypothetical protein